MLRRVAEQRPAAGNGLAAWGLEYKLIPEAERPDWLERVKQVLATTRRDPNIALIDLNFSRWLKSLRKTHRVLMESPCFRYKLMLYWPSHQMAFR